jgi:hypothetical protein
MLGFTGVVALFRLYNLRFEGSVLTEKNTMGPVFGFFNGE